MGWPRGQALHRLPDAALSVVRPDFFLLTGMAAAAVGSVGNPAGGESNFASDSTGLSKSCGQVAADDLSRFGPLLRLVHRTALSIALREVSCAAW